MSDRTDKFDAQFDQTFGMVNSFFKGFWIISGVLGLGLTVGLLALIFAGINYLVKHS